MKAVELHRAASDEVVEAVAWYEHERAGLGLVLFAAIEAALNRVRAAPGAFPIVHGARGVRLLVTAIAHVRRRPGYWLRRLAQ